MALGSASLGAAQVPARSRARLCVQRAIQWCWHVWHGAFATLHQARAHHKARAVEKGWRAWSGRASRKAEVERRVKGQLGKKLHGGNVRLMISGAAPLPIHVQEFLLASMGCAVRACVSSRRPLGHACTP